MTHILPFQKIHTKHCIKKVTEKENQILPSQHTTLMTISKTKYSNANFLIQSHEKGNQWRTLLMNLTSYLRCSTRTAHDQCNIIVCRNIIKGYSIFRGSNQI